LFVEFLHIHDVFEVSSFATRSAPEIESFELVIIIIIIHSFLYRHKVVTSEAVINGPTV